MELSRGTGKQGYAKSYKLKVSVSMLYGEVRIQNSKAHNFVFKSIELDLALNPDSHTQCDLW